MPTDKRGTVVADFSTYAKKEEKGIELKLDGEAKSSKGATLRVVVGKVPPFPLNTYLSIVPTRRPRNRSECQSFDPTNPQNIRRNSNPS